VCGFILSTVVVAVDHQSMVPLSLINSREINQKLFGLPVVPLAQL
jgi:hypothetical protein